MSNNNAAIKLRKRYSGGERQFYRAQLEKVDLEAALLTHIDLRRANLDYANFQKADLSNANLKKSSLIKANLCRANLRNANLTGADLSNANLTGADLTGINLSNANLNKANLSIVRFEKVDITKSIVANFSSANFVGALFLGVDLRNVNLEGSLYDNTTKFPIDFDPVVRGMLKECTVLKDCNVEGLITQFSHLCRCSNKYLGGIITAKYFYSSRPNFDWLNKFIINNSAQITYQGSIADSVSSEQLHWFQQWMDSFTQSCSQIVKDFSRLI